jgi:hypothetical protein
MTLSKATRCGRGGCGRCSGDQCWRREHGNAIGHHHTTIDSSQPPLQLRYRLGFGIRLGIQSLRTYIRIQHQIVHRQQERRPESTQPTACPFQFPLPSSGACKEARLPTAAGLAVAAGSVLVKSNPYQRQNPCDCGRPSQERAGDGQELGELGLVVAVVAMEASRN